MSVTFTPAAGAKKVRPDTQVVVTASEGELASVSAKTSEGKTLAGKLDASGTTWRSTAALAPGTGYTLTAVARNADGVTKTETAGFSTLTPSATTGATVIPGDDWTVGVGMPIVVQFAQSVKNRDAALKALHVASNPQVEGAWYWASSQAVWFRPKTYWPAGTTVKVTANLDSAELSPGVWGRRTYSSSFTVGSAVISTVDIDAHKITVTKDGQVVKTLPVTTGMNTPRYRTRGGIKVIMDKRPVETMDAASTGIPKDDPAYYSLTVHWAMRLTWSGEYIHAAPWSVGSQGRANVSHGCTGMSTSNAKWMYDFSKVGDVVIYENGSRKLEFGNGYTAWELSWEKWSGGAGALTEPIPGAPAAKLSPSASSSSSPSSASSSASPAMTPGPLPAAPGTASTPRQGAPTASPSAPASLFNPNV